MKCLANTTSQKRGVARGPRRVELGLRESRAIDTRRRLAPASEKGVALGRSPIIEVIDIQHCTSFLPLCLPQNLLGIVIHPRTSSTAFQNMPIQDSQSVSPDSKVRKSREYSSLLVLSKSQPFDTPQETVSTSRLQPFLRPQNP